MSLGGVLGAVFRCGGVAGGGARGAAVLGASSVPALHDALQVISSFLLPTPVRKTSAAFQESRDLSSTAAARRGRLLGFSGGRVPWLCAGRARGGGCWRELQQGIDVRKHVKFDFSRTIELSVRINRPACTQGAKTRVAGLPGNQGGRESHLLAKVGWPTRLAGHGGPRPLHG